MGFGRRRTGPLMIAAVLLAGCGATGEAGTEPETTPAAEPAPEASGTYGTLSGVCGDGDYTVDPAEAGVDDGRLNLGVATDRASKLRPGVNAEIWDASVAFARWCNDQGGIGGLEVNPIELSGAVFEVESAMRTACADTFALVGGGFVQDNLEYSDKDGSDIRRCGLIDLPAFTVSPEKTGAPEVVQPVPGSTSTMVTTGLRDFQELFPRDAGSATLVRGDLPGMDLTEAKWTAALDDLGIPLTEVVSYPVTGLTDWTPLAQRVIESGGTTLLWIGEPTNAASLLTKLKEQGWEGRPLFESNLYDELLFSAGDRAAEGAVIRTALHPTEEADRWPAVRQYLDTLEAATPEARTSPLGIASTSAWLLFATAANACARADDGVLTRACILREAAAEDAWSGGGLHAPTDTDTGDEVTPSPCNMLLEVRDGGFTRLHPRIGGEDDDVDGFHCPDDGLTRLPARR